MKPDSFGHIPCTGISDEAMFAEAREAISSINPRLKAMRGKAIVWVCPFRKDGVIEIPWDARDNSVEAVMVSDGTGAEIERGTLVMIRPDEGRYHEVDGVRLCFIERSSLILIQEAA